MFSKILVANRGEIACRIMRTARRMGIETVAVHSEADGGALHTRLADEAVLIGGSAAAESYLRAENVLNAAKQTGAEAIHPGYGFLSENAVFAEEVARAGLTFIGPPASAIACMGDKIEAKLIAEKAGITTIPGLVEPVVDQRAARAAADEIGYPVMIKAAAGGGGKGMRLAFSAEELDENLQSAINEATSAFGDGRVFIEKFIEDPRHIEIQVLADSHGNVIHLGERECSIQRRHQKVIEEAPSPLLDDETRAAMGAEACAMAKAVGYVSAGTVEFVSDQARNFYFLEMNTRLQVEHPVTEMVTGLDLVEQQFRIAAGEKLPLAQNEVKTNGWSLECRLYAEDPARNYVPSIGRLLRYRTPAESETVRIDSGVVEGSEISMFYDPMIAKLVTHGTDRDDAIHNMQMALDEFEISGIAHNLNLLGAVLDNRRFRDGHLSTAFLDETHPDGFDGLALTPSRLEVVIPVAVAIHQRRHERAHNISGRMVDTRPPSEWVVRVEGTDYRVTVETRDAAYMVHFVDHGVLIETDWVPGDPLFRGRVDGEGVTVQTTLESTHIDLRWRGIAATATIRSVRAAELAKRMPRKEPPDLSRLLLSPMPGLVVSIPVAEGETVSPGQAVAVVEAMKMENVLRAEREGRVAKICAATGDSLAVDQVIMEFE